MTCGAEAHADWRARHDTHPEAKAFDRWRSGALPGDWPETMRALTSAQAADIAPRPTIASSGDICDGLAAPLPDSLVLCADLEAPTNHKRNRTAFTGRDRSGNYVHCGVREHLMGAMCNGIAAHGGLRPINVTYFAFADYERPAMRMAALMGLPVVFVFGHDGIGIGSNGPTHQPVEVLASFRAMPNFRVFRPADAVETAEAWDIAMRTDTGPSLVALSKQPADQLRRTGEENGNLCARGAYILHETEGPRDVTLLATGTEVGLAVRARAALADRGIRAAVVSMPCWELFETQDLSYREAVLGDAPRIGIEAAMAFGWERWLRPSDRFVGMTGFGASDHADRLYTHFNITVERIVSEMAETTH